MSKYLILFAIVVSLVVCVPRIRKNLNYDPVKLEKCLKERNIEYNEQVEELRGYHDTLRKYLFNKKFVEYNFKESQREEMIYCFDNFGVKARMVSPGANCRDRCKYERPGQKCNCPRY